MNKSIIASWLLIKACLLIRDSRVVTAVKHFLCNNFETKRTILINNRGCLWRAYLKILLEGLFCQSWLLGNATQTILRQVRSNQPISYPSSILFWGNLSSRFFLHNVNIHKSEKDTIFLKAFRKVLMLFFLIDHVIYHKKRSNSIWFSR